MHVETISSNYVTFQTVIDKTCPKLWTILDTLGPWGGVRSHPKHPPWLQACNGANELR